MRNLPVLSMRAFAATPKAALSYFPWLIGPNIFVHIDGACETNPLRKGSHARFRKMFGGRLSAAALILVHEVYHLRSAVL